MNLSLFSSISGKRAATKIEQLEYQIMEWEEPGDMSDTDKEALERIKHIIKGAREALEAGKTELAWQLLHSAQRIRLRLATEDTLSFRKEALYHEANQKLSGWRKKAVLNSLDSGSKEGSVNIDTLEEAYEVMHEHFSNLYIKNKNMLKQLFTLSVTALTAMLSFLIILWSYHNSNLPAGFSISDETVVPLTLSVILFGIMGACLSAIFSLAGGTQGMRIPKLQVNYWITLSRPVIGAISALVFFIFISSDFILLGQNFNTAGILTISFISGFSERLIIRAVKTVSDETSLDLNTKTQSSKS